MAAGAIEACTAVLQSGPYDAKCYAAGALANISDREQHVGALMAAGAIEACTAVVQTGPDGAKGGAMCVLTRISYCEQYAGTVAAAGAITTLTDTMHSMNYDDKFCAALHALG